MSPPYRIYGSFLVCLWTCLYQAHILKSTVFVWLVLFGFFFDIFSVCPLSLSVNHNYVILNKTQNVYISKEANIWVPIGGLMPFSNYTIQVNASNSQGYVTSDHLTIAIPPGGKYEVNPYMSLVQKCLFYLFTIFLSCLSPSKWTQISQLLWVIHSPDIELGIKQCYRMCIHLIGRKWVLIDPECTTFIGQNGCQSHWDKGCCNKSVLVETDLNCSTQTS